MREEDLQTCGSCGKLYDRNDLVWINDLKVCDSCYEEIYERITNNHYGRELTYYEMWGEEE